MTESSITASTIEMDVAGPAPSAAAPEARAVRRRRGRPPVAVIVAMTWLVVVVLAAVFADLLPIADPKANVGIGSKIRPFQDWSEVFGTDAFGRSILSRLVFGARLSLAAGLGSVAVAMTIGIAIGTLAGYRGGRIDWFVGVATDALLSIPALVLLLAIVAVLLPSLGTVILGLSLIAIPNFVRLARANTLRFASAEFVVAARGLGAKTGTVLFREIVPGVLRSVSVFAAVICAVLILAEAGLSFLGLGVPPPTASWGNMIAEGRQYLESDPHLVFVPVAALFVTILAMNSVGDWLRSRAGGGTVV